MIPLIIMAGMAVAQGVEAQKGAKSANVTTKSNERVANLLRKADNELAAATGSLSRYQQARRNKHLLKMGGDQLNTFTTNMLRIQADNVEGNVNRRISSAEEAGELAVRSSAAGVGGGSIDMLNSTSKLRAARIDQMADSQTKQQLSDMLGNKQRAFEGMVLGLDDVQILDNINMMPITMPRTPVPSTASIALNAGLAFAQGYSAMGGGNLFSRAPAINMQGQNTALLNNPAFVRNM